MTPLHFRAPRGFGGRPPVSAQHALLLANGNLPFENRTLAGQRALDAAVLRALETATVPLGCGKKSHVSLSRSDLAVAVCMGLPGVVRGTVEDLLPLVGASCSRLTRAGLALPRPGRRYARAPEVSGA